MSTSGARFALADAQPFSADRLLISDPNGQVTAVAAATDGQLLIGNTGNPPTLATITGTANRVIVTNAAGSITLTGPQDLHVGASPTFDGLTISASGITVTGNSTITGTLGGITTLTATTLAGTLSTAAQPNVTSVGILTSGTWNATTIDVPHGGTGVATLAANGVLYGNAAGVVLVTAQGAANTVLVANAGAPSFSATPTIGTSVTTPLVIGGTGTTSTLTLKTTTGVGTTNADMIFLVGNDGGTEAMRILNAGTVGIGVAAPTAMLHLKAGTATAGTAPLKLNSGTLLTTAEAGAIEFLTDAFYGTITTGAARKTFAFLESPSFTTPNIGAATGTTLALSGVVTLSGSNSAPGAASGNVYLYHSATLGMVVLGEGTTNDFTIANKSGGQVLNILTGTVNLQMAGKVKVGALSVPAALLDLAAGTATAGTAPLKFTAGTNLTTPEVGAMEFVDNGTTGHLYITLNIAGVLTRVQLD